MRYYVRNQLRAGKPEIVWPLLEVVTGRCEIIDLC